MFIRAAGRVFDATSPSISRRTRAERRTARSISGDATSESLRALTRHASETSAKHTGQACGQSARATRATTSAHCAACSSDRSESAARTKRSRSQPLSDSDICAAARERSRAPAQWRRTKLRQHITAMRRALSGRGVDGSVARVATSAANPGTGSQLWTSRAASACTSGLSKPCKSPATHDACSGVNAAGRVALIVPAEIVPAQPETRQTCGFTDAITSLDLTNYSTIKFRAGASKADWRPASRGGSAPRAPPAAPIDAPRSAGWPADFNPASPSPIVLARRPRQTTAAPATATTAIIEIAIPAVAPALSPPAPLPLESECCGCGCGEAEGSGGGGGGAGSAALHARPSCPPAAYAALPESSVGG